jgi:kynurenine formamidase
MCLPGTIETVRKITDEQAFEDEHAEDRRFDRRSMLLAGAGTALAAAFPVKADASHRSGLQDLTHVFRARFPAFTTTAPFGFHATRRTMVTIERHGFYKQAWRFDEHTGTHMDAPGHFIRNGRRAHQMEPRELIDVPIVVVDISEKVEASADAVVTRDDLRRFERKHGRIPRRALVCMYSGWESRVGDEAAYRNADAAGVYHFPGFGAEAAEWLVEERNITGIGVDTLSQDPGNSTTFPVHITILGADKYGLENLANLRKIPPRGARVYVGLIPWDQGSGGPARVIAHW